MHPTYPLTQSNLYESLCLYVYMYVCMYVCLYVCMSVRMYVCMSIVCMSVCLSHFFWKPYILLLIHLTDILKKYQIFQLKIKNILSLKKIQKSSMSIYKSWFSTVSFEICQNIHFTNIPIKYKIFYIKKIIMFCIEKIQKSSLFL